MLNAYRTDAQTTKSSDRTSSLLLVLLSVVTIGIFATSCTNTIMSEQAAIATATACACNCFPYGSRQYTVPTQTPTPTGTWIPPRPSRTPTPTRPSGGSYATLAPHQPTEPPAWPPPAVTCTARPDQPTLTPRPTIAPPVFPTFPINTPMPSGGSGTSEGRALASMSGNAGIGQPAIDPVTGAPSFIWSQDNTNQATDAEHRVYLRRMDPQSRTLDDALSVNILEPKVGFQDYLPGLGNCDHGRRRCARPLLRKARRHQPDRRPVQAISRTGTVIGRNLCD